MKKILASVLVGLSPLMALAQQYTPNQGVGGLFTFAGQVMGRVVPFIISLAVIFLLWNVFTYAIAGDEEKKKASRINMVYGIVGLFVMVSIWGLVAILQSTFGTSGVTGSIGNQIPQI